ncbi:putative solute:sodium symporter small subunit [Gracilibacillus orientalis]|uniref:Putative solute:sodium symporter small subunit n=1 Tax=Gracilibacillus orientalis TaxID=334253 RepID=A0A1I4NE66_9BACI|nr:DUF4212 domain-containing protein [Gracilibacillus orientalis]SFM13676.1 putative solute:sodium symporter small subunit [Gracilibacillus orientalis]
MNQTLNEKQKWYWKKNIKLIISLLVIWFLVGLGAGVLFAEPLSNIQFFNVSLAFWFAHQGSILVFILLILTYAVRMDKLDKQYKEMLKDGN